MSIKSVKYIHKYIYKGTDRATIVTELDEVKKYLDARYISASESIWRIMRFNMHEEVPNVVRLQIHLENEQTIMINVEQDTSETLMNRIQNKHTKLTHFFHVCATQPHARQYLYQEFPRHFVWDIKKNIWKHRQRGMALGRMYFVPPKAGELFYLRTLLTVVPGPKSFSDLRTFQDITYDTYHQACVARGLLEDDGEWRQCLSDAKVFKTGHQLCKLFVVILHECSPTYPDKLWDDFKEHITDDLKYALQRKGYLNASDDQVYDYGLYLIDIELN
jgi:hypothetical protein